MQEKKSKSKRDLSELRKEQHLKRLETREPKCKGCEETNPAALTGTDPNILCYECQSAKDERSVIEAHHFAGKSNDSFTIPILGNDHRILSDVQRDWPIETLRNPNGSPLIKAAAAIRGWLDILRLLIEQILGWIPPFLEWLDDQLTATHGKQWWLRFQEKEKTK